MPFRERHTEAEAELRRIWKMSTREQLHVCVALRQYFSAEFGDETDFDRQLRLREEAVNAIEQVADHLGLAAGRAPTAQQFNHTCRELDLGWNTTAVADAWGRWRFATLAYLGERVPETPAQRSIRRLHSGTRRNHETYLVGVRLWLDQEPPPATTTRDDYNRFVAKYNEPIAAGRSDELPLVKAASVVSALAIRWEDVIACARGQADYAEVAAQRVRELLAGDAGPLGLIGSGTIAVMLDRHKSHIGVLYVLGQLPRPVAFLEPNVAAWVADDIQRFRDGRPVPDRTEGEMQHLILTSRQLAAELGMTVESLQVHHKKHKSIPHAEGRVGRDLYWTRAGVDRWRQQRAHERELKSSARRRSAPGDSRS